MLERLPIGGLLSALSRSVDALEIARNVHVPAPEGGEAAQPTGSGRAADRPSASALAAAGTWGSAPAATPDRSLGGLRPPNPAAETEEAETEPSRDLPTARAARETRAPAVAPTPPGRPQAADARAAGGDTPERAGPPTTDARAAAPVPDARTADAGAADPSASPIPVGEAGAAGPAPDRPLAAGRAARPDLPGSPAPGMDDPAMPGRDAAIPDVPGRQGARSAGTAGAPGRVRPDPEAERAERPRTAGQAAEPASPVAARLGAPPTAAPDPAAVDGWSLRTGGADGQQVERAGIIASFVLNAAMIPGWPPPRPFAVPEPRAQLESLGRLVRLPGDAELRALLEGRGARPGPLARLRALLGRPARRLRVLLGLAALEAAVATVLDALHEELGRLARQEDEASEEEDRRRFSV